MDKMNDDRTSALETSSLSAIEFARRLSQKKILLLYASSGKGHKSACRAIEEALREAGFDGTLKQIDILDYMPSLLADLFSRGYLFAASRLPWLWYMIYEVQSNLSRFRPPPLWQNSLWKLLLWRLNRFLKSERPDYIISAYFTASWAAGRYKKVHNPSCFVATVITDYGMHPAWLAPGQDRYFVATEEIKHELVPFAGYTSVDAAKIEVVGIPIEKRFTVPKSKTELLRQYRLQEDRFTVLVLAGAYGQHHVETIVKKLIECKSRLQLLMVAGKNFPLSDRLREQLVARDIPYRIYGLIDFMHDLMALADVAITKTGGLTSTECFVSGCPILAYKPYPGQEERNCCLFLEMGAASRIFQLESLPLKIDNLAENRDLHRKMALAARQLAKGDAAQKISTTVLNEMAGQ